MASSRSNRSHRKSKAGRPCCRAPRRAGRCRRSPLQTSRPCSICLARICSPRRSPARRAGEIDRRRLVPPRASRRYSAPPSWPRADTTSRCDRSIASEGAGLRPKRKPTAPVDDGSGERPAEKLLGRSAVRLWDQPGFGPASQRESPKPVVFFGLGNPDAVSLRLGADRSVVTLGPLAGEIVTQSSKLDSLLEEPSIASVA